LVSVGERERRFREGEGREAEKRSHERSFARTKTGFGIEPGNKTGNSSDLYY
jgi:hypothetical protein